MKPFIDPKAKVFFRVVGEDGEVEGETLWAHDLGGDRYKVDNGPFFAYGVSLHDVVFAPKNPRDGIPTFQRVVSKSGNRTVRVLFDPPVKSGNASDKVLRGLVGMGCGYEGASARYVVVNVPSRVDLLAVHEYLVAQKAQWEHCDPTYDELYPSDA